MDVSQRPALERIARVLAAQHSGGKAGGDVSTDVDANWRQHLPDADAVLRTLREPDAAMARAGDPAVWERMIRAAIDQEP